MLVLLSILYFSLQQVAVIVSEFLGQVISFLGKRHVAIIVSEFLCGDYILDSQYKYIKVIKKLFSNTTATTNTVCDICIM